MLGAFYFHDPRLDLVPSEHLASDGVDADFAERLLARPGWTRERLSLLERGVALYLGRYEKLAAHVDHLSPPRLRNVGVVRDAEAVRPYAQILNESTTTLYWDDLDPARSGAELVSYLLALAERMAETGEVSLAAIHLAPWWFERTPADCAEFVRAAEASARPDADVVRAIAAAIPWLRQLRHARLRPPRRGRHREISGTGLLVPRAQEDEPDRLVESIREHATAAVRAFHERNATGASSARREDGRAALHRLCAWLAGERPPLEIAGPAPRTLWTPENAADDGALRARLSACGPEAIASVHGDLTCVADHSARFLGSLRSPEDLPRPRSDLAPGGYAYLHPEGRRIVYDLDEPGIERLRGPGIPYARAMLGARVAHEWAHLAVDGGFVPRTVGQSEWASRRDRLAARLDEVVARLRQDVRRQVRPDLEALAADSSPGTALAALFETRLPDFRANLLATRLQSEAEREAYVRQNVRPLRRDYPPPRILRALVRYVYELQYLRFSAIEDPRTYFYDVTWFERDFFEAGVLDEPAFDALSEAAAGLCLAHAVDESRFLPGVSP